MLKDPIYITAISSISALGNSFEDSLKAYKDTTHHLVEKKIGETIVWVGQLPEYLEKEIEALRRSNAIYKNLDKSVLYAIYVSRKAIKNAGWSSSADFGINIGSSRGATELFEKFHKDFLEENKVATLASPTTTLGNIASWVAHDLQTKGPDISHSITCSTALHALLNGVAWLQGGMADKFLVGGSEAPLTPFTIGQMKALNIYSKATSNNSQKQLRDTTPDSNTDYPCNALDLEKTKNTMVLGEAASVACLEKNNTENTLATIIGIGYATEPLMHNVSISTDAQCFQDSMRMALQTISHEDVDAIVMHAPGTVKGDLSEYNAIKKVFCNKRPFLTTNKWKVGHTFGPSGMLSVEMAVLMLQNQQVISVPFIEKQPTPKAIKYVLVNAVGFGGNAVSVLLSN